MTSRRDLEPGQPRLEIVAADPPATLVGRVLFCDANHMAANRRQAILDAAGLDVDVDALVAADRDADADTGGAA